MASVEDGINATPVIREISSRSLKRPNVRTAIVLNTITLCNRITILIQLNNLESARHLLKRANELCKLIDDPATNDRCAFWSAMIKAAEGDVHSACTELLRCIGILGKLPHESQTWAKYISNNWDVVVGIITRNSADDSKVYESILRQLIDRYLEMRRGDASAQQTANPRARTLYSLLQEDGGMSQTLLISDDDIANSSIYCTCTASGTQPSNDDQSARNQNANTNTDVHSTVAVVVPKEIKRSDQALQQAPSTAFGEVQVSLDEFDKHTDGDETGVLSPTHFNQQDVGSIGYTKAPVENYADKNGGQTRVAHDQPSPDRVWRDSSISPVQTTNVEPGADVPGSHNRLSAEIRGVQSSRADNAISEHPDAEHIAINDSVVAQHEDLEGEATSVSTVMHADQLAFDPALDPDNPEVLLGVQDRLLEAVNDSPTTIKSGPSDQQAVKVSIDPFLHTSHVESPARESNISPREDVNDSSNQQSTDRFIDPATRNVLHTKSLAEVKVSETRQVDPSLSRFLPATQSQPDSGSIPENRDTGSLPSNTTKTDIVRQSAASLQQGSSNLLVVGKDIHQPDSVTVTVTSRHATEESDMDEPAESDTPQEQASPVSEDGGPTFLPSTDREYIQIQSDSDSTTVSSTPVDNNAIIDELLSDLLAQRGATPNQSRSNSIRSNGSVQSRTSPRLLSRTNTRPTSRQLSVVSSNVSSRTLSSASSRILSRSSERNWRPSSVMRAPSISNQSPPPASNNDPRDALFFGTKLPVQDKNVIQSDGPPMRTYQELNTRTSSDDNAIDNLMRGLTSLNRSSRTRPANRSITRPIQRSNPNIKSPPRQQNTGTPGTRRANSILRERLTNQSLIASIQRPAFSLSPTLPPLSRLSIPPPQINHVLPSPLSSISPLDLSVAPQPFAVNTVAISQVFDPEALPIEHNFADITEAAEIVRHLSRRRPSLPFDSSLGMGADYHVSNNGDDDRGGSLNMKPKYQAGARRGSLELSLPTSPLRRHTEVDHSDDGDDGRSGDWNSGDVVGSGSRDGDGDVDEYTNEYGPR